MSLQDLFAALDAESAAELERERLDRETQSAQIVAAARAQAEALRARTVAAATAQARGRARAILAEARTVATRTVRAARADALDAAHAAAAAALEGLPGTAVGAATTAAGLAEAAEALPSWNRVRIHPADAAAVSDRVPAGVTLVADLDDGGCLVTDDEGTSVDNTWRTRFANLWPQLRVELGASWDEA